MFKYSALAHLYLYGLKGIEIGGSAHNPFGLDTINVDRYGEMNTIYKDTEYKICGHKMKVDVVSHGDDLPFEDKSYDFVINSHVIEHFWDPIKAIREWERVARKYIFIIAPHKMRTFDSPRPITSAQELIARHDGTLKNETDCSDTHFSVWDTNTFLDLCKYMNLNVVQYQDRDDKVGNGFTVVIKLD